MYERIGKPEGSDLGSTAFRVEQGGARTGTLHMRAGGLSGIDTGQLGLEGLGLGKGDTDCVDKHQIGAGRGY